MTRPYAMRRTENTRLSADDLTMSDFDPEHEALVSTQQIDHSHELPNLPATFRRSSTTAKSVSPRLDPEYTIDTSAINRAFPEFSDVETSPDDQTEDDFSIELGRGLKNATRNRRDDSRNSEMSLDNSVRSASPAVRLDFPATSTPPRSAMRTASKRAATVDNLRKDAQIRRASQMQKENIDPLAQSHRSKNTARAAEPRHTLAEMHVRARETYDGSYIGDERPQSIPVNTRNTRFGNVSSQVAAAVESASRNAHVRDLQQGKRDPPQNPTFTLDNLTNGSILLPDLPNISELVSGVYEDGTPVFNRHTRPRTTRFVSPPAANADSSRPEGHFSVEKVPIPEDEKALFVSLKLLQDKVADLEMSKSEIEKKLEETREENHVLKAEKSRRQKEQYDRLKLFGNDDGEQARGSTKLLHEKNKLEAVNLALQNRLDVAERKVQVHESTLKSLAQERDSAVTQLGVAYLSTQDLKGENDRLKQENADLRSQLHKLTRLTRRFAGNETQTLESLADSQLDPELVTTSTDQNQAETQKTSNSRRAGRRSKEQAPTVDDASRNDSQSKILKRIEKEISNLTKQRQDEELFSLNLSKPNTTNVEATAQSTASNRVDNLENHRKVPNTGKQRIKRVIVEETDAFEDNTEDLRAEAKSRTGNEADFTMLSYIDDREIAKLRRKLEIERATRKQSQSAISKEPPAKIPTAPKRAASDPPRKSSFKESKEHALRPTSALGEANATARPVQEEIEEKTASRHRRSSEHSIGSQGRRKRAMPEMTSAFILPDITLRHPESATREPISLSESAQKVLDTVAGHDGGNCTVCKRLLLAGVPHNHTDESVSTQRNTIVVPKPTPVSERISQSHAYTEEPTIRPAQPPAEALATVLKSLEDELSHLKMQLALAQQSFSKHDASLGKRQRKALSSRIEKLLKEIDMKADQIYALYDVLEGQKQDGHEMTEKEMEVTLQSIGINTRIQDTTNDITDTTNNTRRRQSVHIVEETDDEYDDLPWEGFESTAETTDRHHSRSVNL